MDFDPYIQLAINVLLTIAAWYRNRKKTKQDVKMLTDVIQDSGQEEADRMIELIERIEVLEKKLNEIKRPARRNKKPGPRSDSGL